MAENPAVTPDDVTAMTCALDRLDHAVSLAEFDNGRRAGLGVYLAVCGWTVEVASMIDPPGPSCPLCRRVLNPRPANIPVQRTGRPNVLVSLLSRLHHRTGAA